MNLIKTSVLNGLAVLIKMIAMFVLNKILAVYVGPAGYAAIGQFQNFIYIITAFAGNAINNAVVKYTAEYHESEQKQRAIWKTAGSIVFLLSISFSFLIFIFREQLSIYIFHSYEYKSIFIWFAIFLLFFNFNTLFLAILNGKKEILKLVIANIAGSIFSLIITSILAIQYHIYGALVALSIYQSVAFIVTLILCYRADWFRFNYLFGEIDKKIARKFSAFVIMALVNAICIPLSQMVIRSYMANTLGTNYAGYWEAMIRLSTAYLMLVTTILSVYYLPRLSELVKVSEIKNEIYLGYKYIFPVAVISGVAVYILREWIVELLFSPSFFPMLDLFLWQMIGDVLKIGSWILSYLMLSKVMTKLYVTTEIFFAFSLVFLTVICVKVFGFEGVSIAHLLNHAFYWIVMSFFIFKSLKEC